MNDVGTLIAALTLKDLLDLSATGMLMIITITLWRRLNSVTDQLIAIRNKVELVAGAVVPVVPETPPESPPGTPDTPPGAAKKKPPANTASD